MRLLQSSVLMLHTLHRATPSDIAAQHQCSASMPLVSNTIPVSRLGLRHRNTLQMKDEANEEDKKVIPATNPQSSVRRVADALGNAVFLAWTIFINAAGGVFTLGLVLNLCGFGYRFVPDAPFVEVKPMNELRADIAFERGTSPRSLSKLFPDE